MMQKRKNVCACERRRVCGVQTRFGRKRQGALTVGKWVCSSVLERSEGGVGLECLRDVLGALCTELVASQTAIESKTHKRQGVLTVGKWVCSSVLERGEGLVLLQTLG